MRLYTSDTGILKGFDYTVTTEPTKELVSATDVSDRMNLQDTEDLLDIDRQVKAVRSYLEKQLNRTLVESKTITAYWQSYSYLIPLPFPPVTSVTSVTLINHVDGTETEQTAGEDYLVEGVSDKSVRMLNVYRNHSIKIVYVTGLTEDGIVDLVKDAIISDVMFWFQNRNNPDETEYTIGQVALSKLRIW